MSGGWYNRYEYACHEGNYALSNVISGARQNEKEGAVVR